MRMDKYSVISNREQYKNFLKDGVKKHMVALHDGESMWIGTKIDESTYMYMAE